MIGRLVAHDNVHALRKKGLEVLLLLLEVMRCKLQEEDGEAPSSDNSSSAMSGTGTGIAPASPTDVLRDSRSPSHSLYLASREASRDRKPEFGVLPMHHRHSSVKKMIEVCLRAGVPPSAGAACG